MIDFHCHLDLYPDPEIAVRDAHEAGAYVLSVTTTPKAWRKTSGLAKGRPRIRTALGLHPQVAHERSRELPLFEALLPETGYVGEVGLDGGRDFKAHAKVQRRVFESILDMSSKAGGRVLSIHSLAAADQVLECLRARPDAGVPILHWFTGSQAQLRRAVDQGCWFSVGLPMTRSQRGRAALAAMPRDRVLTESDGPFVEVGGRPVRPRDMLAATARLADVWGMPEREVNAMLRSNLSAIGSLAAGGPMPDTARSDTGMSAGCHVPT